MIFSVGDHIPQIIAGTKTMTRRPTDRYKEGNLYAVQSCRTCKGIPEGKIVITVKGREYRVGNPLKDRWTGYPLLAWEAKAEGGYTPAEFEDLYEKMHPGWTERWIYLFTFLTTEELKWGKDE